jgi:hypothetical protein
MALNDLEAFLRQRLVVFDPSLDVNPGSPVDTSLIQPLLRRLGNDPFTADLTTFINDRLVQAFPDLATKEGDAVTDLLNKPASLLWDPIVREITRVRRNLSFSDPSTLTEQEADALGANFFSERRKGEFARGSGRIFFSSPQQISINPVNFFTTKGGLHFFPSEIQSIRTEEMILNLSAEGLYYFDVNTVAESPGSKYRIAPNELVSVANVPAAVRVQNLRRFGFGEDEEGTQEFVDRVRQELSERSLVTLRGIAAKLLNSFPEVNRLNVVGFNDPEMQRDIVKGGGLGELVASGNAGIASADGESGQFTRRFSTTEVDFQSAILGADTSFVMTVWDAFGPVVLAQDLNIREVISPTEVDFEEQTMFLGAGSATQSWQFTEVPLRWTLRKRTLTLSDIPGGILFPDGPNGTVEIPDDEIHVGGTYDVHVRGSDFDEASVTITNLTDDDPILEGAQLFTGVATNLITLDDLVLDGNYEVGDSTYNALLNAARFGFTLQILTGVDAANYQVQLVSQVSAASPVLTLDQNLTSPALTGPFKWRLVDEINIDLIEPKETRIAGSDLRTVQGSPVVDTIGGTDFNEFGTSENDVMRIFSGPDAGDFTVTADPVAPFDKLILDTPLTQSQDDLDYLIFRPNIGGGVVAPLVRVREIELLDSSSQPVGSFIPYANPVDVQSRAFQNPARGIKHDLVDVRLGLVTREAVGGVFTSILAGQTIDFLIDGIVRTVSFAGGGPTFQTVINVINSQIETLTSIPDIAVAASSTRVGIRPASATTIYVVGGTGIVGLFGSNEVQSTGDVRSATVEAVTGGWDALSPSIDITTGLDVLQPLDGSSAGFYGGPFQVDLAFPIAYGALGASTALQVGSGTDLSGAPVDDFQQFAPEAGRRVQIGVRSIGSVRTYYLAPTSIEFDSDESVFTLQTATGPLRFIPDPSITYQQIPSLPNGVQPADGSITGGTSVITSLSQNFVLSNILEGDKLVVNNHPIAGTIVLPDPVPAVAGSLQRTIVFSLDGGPDRTLVFIRDDVSLNEDECTRQGIADQINAAAGSVICEITGADTLRFTTDRDLVIRSSGTSNGLIDVTAATGTLTLTAIPLDTETVVIDGKTYTFQTVLTNVDGNVQIAASSESSLDNLLDAINLGPGAGVDYAAATTLHPTVSATDGPLATLDVTANIIGDTGNTITTTTTVTGGSWADPTLTGGVTFPGLLGDVFDTGGAASFVTDDQSNASPQQGTYDVLSVTATGVTITVPFPPSAPFLTDPVTQQTYTIERLGVQRISTTAMSANEAEAGLYYFDVELVSEGSGDVWNIAAALQLSVTGFRSDGYSLTTDNEDLSFSETELPKLILSRSILEDGVDDDPGNATFLTNQNIIITYDRAGLVSEVQNFLSSDVERVVCSSPLGRHLLPHFVRYDLRYVGGSKESVVVPELEQQIRDLFPFEALESSDIQKVLLDRGATSILNPLDIIAIVHYPDRSIFAARSQNSLTTGRLAAFIPDLLDVQRDSG